MNTKHCTLGVGSAHLAVTVGTQVKTQTFPKGINKVVEKCKKYFTKLLVFLQNQCRGKYMYKKRGFVKRYQKTRSKNQIQCLHQIRLKRHIKLNTTHSFVHSKLKTNLYSVPKTYNFQKMFSKS